MSEYKIGRNSVIGENVKIGLNVIIRDNCIIEDDVILGDNVYIDSNTIIRSDVSLGADSTVGANCIIGEYQMDFYRDRSHHVHPLNIGKNALIRSGSIIYSGSDIGDNFQTGHQVTIRENSRIGNNVSVGTLCDIQGDCYIGNYVRLHSNIFVAPLSRIDDCVWIFANVILTNDPTPPSENMLGVHIHSFCVIAAGSIVLPGIEIKSDSVVGAGAVVTKDVDEYSVVVGNPAKQREDIRKIKNKITGEKVYPWRYYFDRAMPWEGIGFDEWYNSLDEDYKKMLLG